MAYGIQLRSEEMSLPTSDPKERPTSAGATTRCTGTRAFSLHPPDPMGRRPHGTVAELDFSSPSSGPKRRDCRVAATPSDRPPESPDRRTRLVAVSKNQWNVHRYSAALDVQPATFMKPSAPGLRAAALARARPFCVAKRRSETHVLRLPTSPVPGRRLGACLSQALACGPAGG